MADEFQIFYRDGHLYWSRGHACMPLTEHSLTCPAGLVETVTIMTGPVDEATRMAILTFVESPLADMMRWWAWSTGLREGLLREKDA